ncbi:hypothetical protein CTU88_38815 [Streptomyces sp. JV178]|nr:hypothetical protein CTU88_38815 [Streptomyces sp. JV178]
MSEEPNPMPNLRPLVPSAATDWLRELCGDGPTGFMPTAMPDAVWVLNAMHEHDQGPHEVQSSVSPGCGATPSAPPPHGRYGRADLFHA